ncbi:MAG: ABC-F family ATP-binding cassette domain-containing protein [Chitinivibrionales bacterium]|nr:ABC-F family ATP-binding cassette domain-containing protein [Chitinivibrionales bacterium]
MIVFSNISKHYSGRPVFEGMNVSLNEQHHIGLIGPNGSGKTTLFRILSGETQPDDGRIILPPGFSCGYLPQEVEVLGEKSPLEIVLEPFSHVVNYESRIEELSGIIAHHNTPEEARQQAMAAMAHLWDQVEHHDAFALASRAEAILAGLGVPEAFWQQPIPRLSGGFRMRVVLAQLLLLAPSMLLLDEPTNHLDMDSLIWLEKFLGRFEGGTMIISHDREFLNRMSTTTAEIYGNSIVLYKGNYDAYLAQRDAHEEAAANAAKNMQRELNQTRRFIDRFRAKSTKASQVQSRIKKVQELKEAMPTLRRNAAAIDFSFPPAPPCGNVPLKVERAAAAYGDLTVFKNLNLSILRGEKAAIIGPNGAGKSTLLKLCAGLLAASEGAVVYGHNCELRYFGQHQLEQLNPELTLYQTIAAAAGSGETTYIRNVLGAFLFGNNDIDKTVKVLSGGEKSRLVLASILARPGNVLLLDEPTNHLDIQSVEILTGALQEFDGTVLFVSHNEYFVNAIATRIIEMRPDLFRDFPGSLDDYRYYCESLFGLQSQNDANKKSKAPDKEKLEKEQRIKQRELQKQLARKIEKIERQIQSCESELESYKTTMHDPANSTNYELLQSTNYKFKNAEKENARLLKEWEALQEESESN